MNDLNIRTNWSDYIYKLINKSDEKDDIMKFPHSNYLYKHIYCDSPSVYYSIISAKSIDKIVSKIYNYTNEVS